MAAFAAVIGSSGVAMSSLFKCPGFTYFMVMVDVLHTLELGVTQEVLGNGFFECLSSSLCAGRNRAAQVSLLFQRIKDFYRTHRPTSQIANLTIEMVKQPGKPPRFRGKAAETRHLVPFAMLLVNDLVAAHPGTHNETVKNAVRQLYWFYMTMGTSPFDQANAATSARRFCVLYSALRAEAERAGINSWRIKLKLHCFLELAEFQTNESGDPSNLLAYKDEDFVGMVGTVGHSRGGSRSATHTAENVLKRYRGLAAD